MNDDNSKISLCISQVNDLFDLLGMAEVIREDEIVRQVTAAYLFGFANAFAFEHHLSPPQLHGIVLSTLKDKFEYSNQQAVDFSKMLIDATQPSADPTINEIIHHGIDSYYQYISGQGDEVAKKLATIIEEITS